MVVNLGLESNWNELEMGATCTLHISAQRIPPRNITIIFLSDFFQFVYLGFEG